MSCKMIIDFLKDSKKEVKNSDSLREIDAWIKKLKKYPHSTLYEQDLKKLTYVFEKWR